MAAALAVAPAGVDPHVAANAPTQTLQLLQKRSDEGLKSCIIRGDEHANTPYALHLLRLRHKRPSCQPTGNHFEEIAPPHSRPRGQKQRDRNNSQVHSGRGSRDARRNVRHKATFHGSGSRVRRNARCLARGTNARATSSFSVIAQRTQKRAVQAIQRYLHQPKAILSAQNPFSAPDRATLNQIRARTEQIEKARRYWACPFR